jgi:hypothetical protein
MHCEVRAADPSGPEFDGDADLAGAQGGSRACWPAEPGSQDGAPGSRCVVRSRIGCPHRADLRERVRMRVSLVWQQGPVAVPKELGHLQ